MHISPSLPLALGVSEKSTNVCCMSTCNAGPAPSKSTSTSEAGAHKLHYWCIACQTKNNIPNANLHNANDVRQHCGTKKHIIGMQVG